MRSVLVGTLESTRLTLDALCRAGHAPAALLTLPREKAHRHSDFLDLSPEAKKHGVPVIEVENINSPGSLAQLKKLQPDYLWVIGWSQICKPPVLSIATFGGIGFHPSPLPENRGRAVIPWTILQQRATTGSTLFHLSEGVDAGDILAQEIFPVAADETAQSLYDKHCQALTRLLESAIPQLAAGSAPRIPQDHARASWCAKRTADDGCIHWNQPAEQIWTLIRAAGRPYPGAWSWHRGKQITLWDAKRLGGPGADSAGSRYCGLPGQVQAFDGDAAIVQCGDGRQIVVRTVQVSGEAVPSLARAVLKLHEKLGLNLADLERRMLGDAR